MYFWEGKTMRSRKIVLFFLLFFFQFNGLPKVYLQPVTTSPAIIKVWIFARENDAKSDQVKSFFFIFFFFQNNGLQKLCLKSVYQAIQKYVFLIGKSESNRVILISFFFNLKFFQKILINVFKDSLDHSSILCVLLFFLN